MVDVNLRTNYARLGHVAQHELSNLLRELLLTKEPPSILQDDASVNPYLSQSLMEDEWRLIKNVDTNNYAEFDTPLMYKLFRDLSIVPSPTRNWQNLIPPLKTERTIGDDIERVKRVSNEIIHRRPEVTDSELKRYFDIMKGIAARFESYLNKTKGEYVTKFQQSETCCLDTQTVESYLKELNIIVDREKLAKRKSSEIEIDKLSTKEFSDQAPRTPLKCKMGELIGRGGFAEVYLCYDKITGKEMAVKQVRLGRLNAETSKEVRALKNEIELLRTIEHERIVRYYDYTEEDGKFSIFMEYLSGGSLKDILNKNGSFTEAVTRQYTRHLLEGLAVLHKLRIMHRDIKAANILRDSKGNTKLGDFGTAKQLATICTLVGHKTFIGTYHWMAPEVIRSEPYGRRADIWSLGCTIVEMLTGKPPYPDLESQAALFKIATEDHPRYKLPTNVSKDSYEILQLTFKKYEDRPTAEELLKHKFVTGS